MSVRVEKQGPVTTVILSRPWRERGGSGDGGSLATPFGPSEADADASVAVLWGEGGTFCAGADLKAFAAGKYDHVSPEGDGRWARPAAALDKPAIAGSKGYAVAGASSWPSGAT